jgi:hypothetical protein
LKSDRENYMSSYILCLVLLLLGTGVTYVFMRTRADALRFELDQTRQNVASVKRETDRHESELRDTIDEPRGREREAKNRADEAYRVPRQRAPLHWRKVKEAERISAESGRWMLRARKAQVQSNRV